MAKGHAVWGIDIGQAALKALRCSLDEDGETLNAEAFDYIEYPMLLSQPDADPRQIVRDALKLFLSRNSVRGDKVAISVAVRSGLARFIKLPPVESKKIPDIVKYEARQQIPFDLEDVIWDYQEMPGGSEDEGIKLETEVGLFAMKRDQVFRSVEPYDDAGIELDIVQLTPLSIYNFVVHDVLGDLSTEDYDPEDPPPSHVVVSMGTDTTDLVITNGFRVWQRSVPLGGNHFTRQLTKEMKLTFAKAEHLKRNAREAENAKAIIQAMRPVYSDLTTEIQRSISFFQSIDRNAKISGMICLGNANKLPGLQQYLAKNLDCTPTPIDRFRKLAGSGVVSAPSFKENLLSFAVCYGLCLQGLGKAALHTTLLPREILVSRLVRRKKPWAVASAAVVLLACATVFIFCGKSWWSVNPERAVEGVPWKTFMSDADNLDSKAGGWVQEDEQLQKRYTYLTELSQEVIGPAEGRLLWPELLKAINQQLPYDREVGPGRFTQLEFGQRPSLHIQEIDAKYYSDLGTWFTDARRDRYEDTLRGVEALATGQALPEEPAEGEATPEGEADAPPPLSLEVKPPEGAGWVVQLTGFHYHNGDPQDYGMRYLTRSFLCKLVRESPFEGDVLLPTYNGGANDGSSDVVQVRFKLHELGISHPILVESRFNPDHTVPNPEYQAQVPADAAAAAGPGGTPPPRQPAGDNNQPEYLNAAAFHFVIQFCWQETRLSERLKRQLEEQLEAEQSGSVAALRTGEGL